MSEVLAGLSAPGLCAAGAPVPLEGVAVEAQLEAFAARVTLRQRYRNREDRPIEAVYVFPLDEGAAVCGFEAEIGGVRVVAQVEEREAAFARYDDALAAGHGAYLLDQERPDVFTASLGNVPPGAEVTITLVTVSELALAGEDVRFVLPTTVSPRYAPPQDWCGVGRSPAEAVKPPVALAVPYGLNVTVDVDMGLPLRAVESPSHAIKVELDGPRARVSLAQERVPLDCDFVLSLRTAEATEPQAWVEQDEQGRTAAMLAFRPRFEAGPAPSEVVFLVDRSGSMDGTSIAEARNALQLCLRSLSAEHLFNIVGFGSEHRLLFPSSRPYDEASLAEAGAHVAALRADMGGTEILGALEAVFALPVVPERPRQLFLLTDGQVSNTAAVLALVRRHAHTTRVFAFGIGAGASQHLVRGVARAGEGAAEFIAPGERIEAKVVRQLERALAPAVCDLSVDWGGLPVTQAPHRVPPVFAGGRLVVYGLLGEQPAAGVRVALRGRGPQGSFEFGLTLGAAHSGGGQLISKLAARSAIRDLEEGLSVLHDRQGSLQERGREDRVKAEIVRLGTTFGLASRETSFVAVEQRATPTTGQAELRRVPVALTRGWGGAEDGRLMAVAVRAAAPVGAPAARLASWISIVPDPMDASYDLAQDAGELFKAVAGSGLVREERSAADGGRRPLDRLVALQRADGAWELDQDLARILGRALADLELPLRGVRGEAGLARRAWATALALRWLERHAAEQRDEWRLLARKAASWLAGCAARPPEGDWAALAAQWDA